VNAAVNKRAKKAILRVKSARFNQNFRICTAPSQEDIVFADSAPRASVNRSPPPSPSGIHGRGAGDRASAVWTPASIFLTVRLAGNLRDYYRMNLGDRYRIETIVLTADR
jgi:hypothetical protein